MPRADVILHEAGRELSASCHVPKQQYMPPQIVQAHKVHVPHANLWLTERIARKRLDMQVQRRMLVRHAALRGPYCALTLQRMWSCT